MSRTNQKEHDSFREILESNPVETALSRIDSALDTADEAIAMEVAEDTYADLKALTLEDTEEYTLSKATVYVDKELDYLQEKVPESDFSLLSNDEPFEAHELVYPEITLRIKFGEQHKTAFPLETNYQNINVSVPAHDAYAERTVSTFNEYFSDAD